MIFTSSVGGYDYQKGFDLLRTRYNVVWELMDRPDVKDVLIEKYCAYVVDQTNHDNPDYQVDIDLTQLVLNQYEIVISLTTSQKRALVEKTESIYSIKQSLPGSFTLLRHGLVLIGRIIYIDEYTPLMQSISDYKFTFQEFLDIGYADIFESLILDMGLGYIDAIVYCKNNEPIPFDLMPVSPNPFNPATTISFTLPESAPVVLSVYSMTGQKVATLVDGPMSAGAHAVQFDGTGLASGIYVYRLESAGYRDSGKMLLVK